MKRLFISILCATALTGVAAQTPADTTQVVYDTTEEVMYDNDRYKVETNHFFDNWFVSGGFGGEIIFGNHDKQVKFFDRIAPALDIVYA